MTLESLYSVVYSFLVSNQPVALVILVGLAVLMWKKPWGFFKLSIAVLALLALVYLGTLLSGSLGTGMHDKSQMINETKSKMSE